MKLYKHIKLAGALLCIGSVFANMVVLAIIGLCLTATGVLLQVDDLERRLTRIELKEIDDETEA